MILSFSFYYDAKGVFLFKNDIDYRESDIFKQSIIFRAFPYDEFL
jgi:hypothetical protein